MSGVSEMSFYVFSGNDRVTIQKKIQKILGADYEVFEGSELDATSLMEICTNASLFATERRILIKDLTLARKSGGPAALYRPSTRVAKCDRAAGPLKASPPCELDTYEILAKYADTPHAIVIWESTTSLKKSFKEFCKLPQVTKEKIDLREEVDRFAVFRLFDEAVAGNFSLEKYRALNSDPYMTVGALASWAINKYKFRGGAREKRILKEVAELDMQTKSSRIAAELLVEAFLMRLSAI